MCTTPKLIGGYQLMLNDVVLEPLSNRLLQQLGHSLKKRDGPMCFSVGVIGFVRFRDHNHNRFFPTLRVMTQLYAGVKDVNKEILHRRPAPFQQGPANPRGSRSGLIRSPGQQVSQLPFSKRGKCACRLWRRVIVEYEGDGTRVLGEEVRCQYRGHLIMIEGQLSSGCEESRDVGTAPSMSPRSNFPDISCRDVTGRPVSVSMLDHSFPRLVQCCPVVFIFRRPQGVRCFL